MASRTSSKSVLSALVQLLHTHTLSNSVVMENDNFFQVTYIGRNKRLLVCLVMCCHDLFWCVSSNLSVEFEQLQKDWEVLPLSSVEFSLQRFYSFSGL